MLNACLVWFEWLAHAVSGLRVQSVYQCFQMGLLVFAKLFETKKKNKCERDAPLFVYSPNCTASQVAQVHNERWHVWHEGTRRFPNRQSLISNCVICFHSLFLHIFGLPCERVNLPSEEAAFKIHNKLISFEYVSACCARKSARKIVYRVDCSHSSCMDGARCFRANWRIANSSSFFSLYRIRFIVVDCVVQLSAFVISNRKKYFCVLNFHFGKSGGRRQGSGWVTLNMRHESIWIDVMI